MDVKKFKRKPVLGILRGGNLSTIEPLVETVIESGLETLEITMNTPDAPALIQKAVETAKGRLTIGAGTVINMDSLKAALAAGATFIVMPVIIKDVIHYCVKKNIPVFPGALTPNEIYWAWGLGATMVKVFPAKALGPEYFKKIKGPFSQVKLLACGGVTPKNMQDYFTNGADAIAIGGSVFKKEWIEKGDFKSIRKSLNSYLGRYK
ncbi:MAG: bifunctional 4-hydroxy-2-oxoglutarate aldolase/2-dehydro-3-deoxy-phosphogluconate aldolase [Candidatus Margulisbacteria bacterium]|nr:bifunctional 4-hydroxy-2-oxoglutarate aldolase/2-dehydro-3-deoxy-phosphogluconate aldolase [Candidatus Margulisiibacteriota bacterium]MBU1021807.1 bifunctional 4-hydroxy-2-oxoglutarate aldolase/2-dehydro-3-deoxy-phosphogluconate aldolase [Candidatus Margulisiibacteriota bacterium]MBU1729272.1 bifunctional 4-hydroxy-2-oxoglutarate aldolase/2-dehydro-3-deoxy-phosphogluconate aldolase [Candidatus Margulisiibacteriota bacterium]MBU1955545.1 bifunctional 4-hydroxy-2-oxoglutarate aldolase/2-dehydro